MNKDESDKKLSKMFRQLPEELTPPAQIWERIEADLDRREQGKTATVAAIFTGIKRGYRYLGAAAAILIAALLLNLFIFNYYQSENMKSSNAYRYSQAMKELDETAREYNRTKDRLLTLVESNEGLLTEETVTSIRTNIELMDSALEEIKLALEREPNNGELLAQLSTMYYEETLMLARTGELLESASN